MNTLRNSFYFLSLAMVSLLTVQCGDGKKKDMPPEPIIKTENPVSISKAGFGETADGAEVESYVLKNENGMEVEIITYGGIINSLKVPNNENLSEDVVLGYDSLDQYIKGSPYFGAIIGRYGNRIANGKFTIDDVEYSLAVNDGKNHLHGGLMGFDKVIWNAETVEKDNAVALELSYLSKDMEEGYPGNLECKVTYTLNNSNVLDVLYEATTDKKTVINLTQHSYFNLSGDFSKPILDHEVSIDSDQFLPVDATLIPTGQLKDVKGTPFDFRTAKPIGQDIDADDEQLKKGGGFDHCWVLNDQDAGMRLAATAYHKESGRYLEVFSDEPAIQFYTGNFLDGTLPAKNGGTYGHRSGFCLETQHYPDSPNQESFPSVVLAPGEKYETRTSFKFTVK